MADMRLDKEVLHENRKMALGCFVCTALVLAGFLIARRFDYTVVIGGIVGWMLAVGNFFFMSLGIVKALETGDENAAKMKMHSSYIARTIVMLAVMALSIIVDFIHWIPVVVSVFYPRIVITAVNLINLAKSRKQHLAEKAAESDTSDEESGADEAGESLQPVPEDETEGKDAIESFMKGFYKGTVPGEEKSSGNEKK